MCERVIRCVRLTVFHGTSRHLWLSSHGHRGSFSHSVCDNEGETRNALKSFPFSSPSPLFHSITHSSSAPWLHSSTRLSSCTTFSSVIMAVMTAASFCLDVSPLFCLWMHHVAKRYFGSPFFYSPVPQVHTYTYVPQVHTYYSTYNSNNNNWVIIPNLTLTHVVILNCPVLSWVGTL